MSQNYWLGGGCGYTAKGDQPVLCPICRAAGDKFTLIDKSMFEAAAKTEGTLETELAYDDVPMAWTKDAKEAIRAVPAGFQRRRCKAKVEKTARKIGMTTITRSEEHTSELQSQSNLVCRLLLEKKNNSNRQRLRHASSSMSIILFHSE